MTTAERSPVRKRLSILHIITGLADGGAEGVLCRLIAADRANCHEVISLMDAGRYGAVLSGHGIAVTTLGMPRGRLTGGGLWRLWRQVRAVKPDIIQTWMYHADLVGGLVARLERRKGLVWNIRNASLDKRLLSRRTRIAARLCAWTSRRWPARIVTCSARAAAQHGAFGYDPSKLAVVPNGYDTSRFAPDPSARATIRNELRLGKDVVAVGMVARWNVQKDHRNLLEALASYSRRSPMTWRCLLVGPGMVPANTDLRDLIADAGIGDDVVLLGPRSDVPAVMNAIDIHVLSSASEGFPNVVAEAMASGTPCIVTDVGDAAVIVGETGWVVPAHDSAKLAAALEMAIGEWRAGATWVDRKLRARERIITQFSMDRMVQAYSEVWHEAVEL